MRARVQRILHRTRGDDRGIAMIMAILLSMIMVLIPVAMMTATTGQLPLARYDQDRATALAAAEAGVQDYINRLNHNPNYWIYNSTNPPPDGNQALASPTVWVPVSTVSSSSFHYSVDPSQVASQGVVYLTSYGKSRNVTRTIKVGLRQYGFLDNLSLSNYNLVDPVLQPVVGNSVSTTTTDCVYDYWQANPTTGHNGPDMSKCGSLINYWVTGSTINGPIRSNDDYYICGNPVFTAPAVTGDALTSDAPYWHDPAGICGTDKPVFQQPYTSTQAIQPSGTIQFPPNDATIQNYTASGQPGCLFTGPTAVQINGTNMTIVSPDSRSTNGCALNTPIPIASHPVIYVQNQPASSSDPNYYSSCQVNPSWDGQPCGNGDVFVQGALNGELTIAAQDDIFITGDLTYNSFTGATVLGLIANNFVLINHPIDGTGKTVVGTEAFGSGGITFKVPVDYGTSTCPGSSTTNSSTPPQCTVTVDAAILTVNHSLGTANFTTGGVLGTINLTGAISGTFMDIEGVFGSSGLTQGYNSNYTYDTRLGHLTPPYFLDPSKTTWHPISYEECSTASCV